MNDSYTDKLKSYAEIAANNLPNFEGNFKDVANYFGYRFTAGQETKKEVDDFLFSEIAKELESESDGFAHKNLKKIRSQLIIDEIVFGVDIYDVYTATEMIWDATRQIKIKDLSDPKAWIKCCELALAKRALGYAPFNSRGIHTEDVNYANAIKFFRAKKINIVIVDGDIANDDNEINKISDAIIHKAKRLGKKGLDCLNSDLYELYAPRLERFLIQRNVKTYDTTRDPSIPYGFLLNITAKFIGKEPEKRIKEKRVWEELKNIAINYIALYRFEPYTPYKQMYGMGDDFLTTIQHSILYDNIFLFKQLSFKHATPIIKRLFDIKSSIANKLESDIGFSLEDVINLLTHIENQAKENRAINFPVTSQWMKTSQTSISPSKVDTLLKHFSRTPKGLNKRYKSPFDYTHSEIDDYPIIQSPDLKYKLVNIGIFPVQIFERYAALIRDYDNRCQKNDRVNIDQLIGDNMETLLEEYFSDNGITFLSGEKYKIDTSMRSYLNTTREDGECDFIIETEKTIFFFELKKKALTRRSSSGYIEDILNDMALSFFSAQVQAGYHEAILRKYGEIIFTSGSKLQHNGRDIQRVSVSLLDFNALQDQTTIDNILYSLAGSKISGQSNDPEVIRKLNKLQKNIDEFTQQIQLDSMAHYTSDNVRPYADIRYFSIPQILTILENCSSNDDFEKEINITRCVSDGSLNWYTQYHRLRSSKLASQIASHPNLHNAIIQI